MTKLTLLLTALVACGSAPEPPYRAPHDVAPDTKPEAPLCCQLPTNTGCDVYVYGCVFSCGPSQDYSDLPWICFDGTTEVSCTNPSCVAGSPCHTVDGDGIVKPCY